MRFSIRDMLLVTVIASLALAWWVDHRRQLSKEESLVRAKEIAEGRFDFLRGVMRLEGYKINEERDENGFLVMTAKPPGFLPNSTTSAPNQPQP